VEEAAQVAAKITARGLEVPEYLVFRLNAATKK
jgi:hypothetical protein